jgi:hypothetical protein
MILDFCAVCGTKEDLHQHHIVPIALSGKNRTPKDETITVCSYHHDVIHGVMKDRKGYQHHELIRDSLKKRKDAGLPMGRPKSITKEKIEAVLELIAKGVGVREICRRLKIGSATYYNIARNVDPYKIIEKPKIDYKTWLNWKNGNSKFYESSRKKI